MSIQYDDKGKVFSHIVTKDVILARIQTVTSLITGEIYVEHNKRIKDVLEFTETFIAITNASVYASDGALAYEAPFLTLNRNHIVWLAIEETQPEESN
jgi:hypothetical protein